MRKFTTQILSLLTALSFAGALSAQTVGDIGAASDGDSAGMSGLGLKVGITLGKNSNVMNQTGQAIWAGLAGGGGAANFIATKSSANECVTADVLQTSFVALAVPASNALAATDGTTCSITGDGSASSSAAIMDLGLDVQYDVGQFINVPLFLRTGFMYSLVGKNEYSVTYSENLAVTDTAGGALAATAAALNGKNATKTLTISTEASYTEIPVLLGYDLMKTEDSTFYMNLGVVFINGEFTNKLSAADTYTDATTATALGGQATYLDVSNTIKASGMGLRWAVGASHEVANNVSIFGEVMFTEASAVDATISGTAYDGTSTYASDHPLFAALPSTTQTQIALTGARAEPLAQGTNASVNGAASANVKTVATTVVNLSSTRWQLGAHYRL